MVVVCDALIIGIIWLDLVTSVVVFTMLYGLFSGMDGCSCCVPTLIMLSLGSFFCIYCLFLFYFLS